MATALKSSKRTNRSVKPPRSTAVRQLPIQDRPPQWLRSLLLIQQASVVATFVLAGSVLAVYGWTVYSQQLWGKEYQKLENLRRSERQFATNSEVLKNQIVKQSERPDAGMVPQSPDNLVFLKPAPARPGNTIAPASQASSIPPLGY